MAAKKLLLPGITQNSVYKINAFNALLEDKNMFKDLLWAAKIWFGSLLIASIMGIFIIAFQYLVFKFL